jgi:hypothetical protein
VRAMLCGGVGRRGPPTSRRVFDKQSPSPLRCEWGKIERGGARVATIMLVALWVACSIRIRTAGINQLAACAAALVASAVLFVLVCCKRRRWHESLLALPLLYCV